MNANTRTPMAPTLDGELPPLDELTCRPLRSAHELAGIARLYNVAGWGPVDAGDIAHWFLGGALGDCLITVLADDRRDEIVGMITLGPYRVLLGDREGVAARARALVLDPRLRRRARRDEGEHPVARLVNEAHARLPEHGWEFSFMLPNPNVMGRVQVPEDQQRNQQSMCELGPGRHYDIEDVAPHRAPLEVTVGRGFGADYDTLWRTARRTLGIDHAVARDAAGLAHARTDDLCLELRRPGSSELVGYATVRNHEDGKLHDLLAVDEDALVDTFSSTIAWLRANPSRHELHHLSTLVHPTYRRALDSLEHEEIAWTFTFVLLCPRDQEVGEAFDASRYYVTTGD